MKIESSEISISANTNFKLEQKHSNEFVSHMIEAKVSTKETIQKENFVRLEVAKLEMVLLNTEKDLSHQERIKKGILETLLRNFTNDKDFKLHPSDEEFNRRDKFVKIEEKTFTYTKEYFQESSLNFQTTAKINTNRGEINIDLDLKFSQTFHEVYKEEFSSKKITFLDPLIINYKSNLTSFDNISSSMKFEFDLNSDGIKEYISTVKEGSGFIALDKDKNGTIDNGNELFGANTGDGFKELSEYDEDNNQWIDENDSIFNKLLVWEKNEKDEANLISFAQAGIGAIYLGSTDSAFTYSSGINENYARLKESSIFLKENGEAGVVTSVDLATEKIV